METAKKWVYKFNEGNAQMKELLGGKGANLAEMTNLGLPIPMGFTITTEACTDYYKSGRKISNEIQRQIFEALHWLEMENGKNSATTAIRCLFPYAAGHGSPCRA